MSAGMSKGWAAWLRHAIPRASGERNRPQAPIAEKRLHRWQVQAQPIVCTGQMLADQRVYPTRKNSRG